MPEKVQLITTDATPALAEAGQTVSVTAEIDVISWWDVSLNAWLNVYVKETGTPIIYWSDILWFGIAHTETGTFVMPNRDVTVRFEAYYHDGTNWILDHVVEVPVTLSAAPPEEGPVQGRTVGTIYNEFTNEPYVPKPGDMTRIFLEWYNPDGTVNGSYSWPIWTSTYDSGWLTTTVAASIQARADVQQPDGTWKVYWSTKDYFRFLDGITVTNHLFVPVPVEEILAGKITSIDAPTEAYAGDAITIYATLLNSGTVTINYYLKLVDVDTGITVYTSPTYQLPPNQPAYIPTYHTMPAKDFNYRVEFHGDKI